MDAQPKPRWISMAALAESGGSLRISCYAPGCRERQMRLSWNADSITPEDAAARWGGFEITLADVRARWRCPICGKGGHNALIDVLTPQEHLKGMGAR